MTWPFQKKERGGQPVVLFKDPVLGMALAARIARRRDFRPRWVTDDSRMGYHRSDLGLVVFKKHPLFAGSGLMTPGMAVSLMYVFLATETVSAVEEILQHEVKIPRDPHAAASTMEEKA